MMSPTVTQRRRDRSLKISRQDKGDRSLNHLSTGQHQLLQQAGRLLQLLYNQCWRSVLSSVKWLKTTAQSTIIIEFSNTGVSRCQVGSVIMTTNAIECVG